MKRSRSGSKSCHSGEDVIGRTRPLDTALPLYLDGVGKAVSRGQVLLARSATTSSSGGHQSIAFHCLIQLPLSYHRTRALSTARLQRAWRLAPTHIFHKIRASLYVRNLMFARLIFACCADIKPRVTNIFNKHGICPQPLKSHEIEKYKCDKNALEVIVMYSWVVWLFPLASLL